MKKLIIVITTLLALANTYAAKPEWTVSPSGFQYSMQVYALAEIGGVALNNTNDMLAAFSGGECRGVVQASYNSFIDKYMFFLVVYANSSNDILSFKVYDAASDQVKELSVNVDFAMNADIGSVVVPYTLSDVEQINGLEITVLNADENLLLGTPVARFTYLSNGNREEATFSLVQGFGDNASFTIAGDSLCLNTSWNYELQSEYSIKIQSSAASGNVTEVFDITLNDLNEAPTALMLSKDSIDENTAVGSVVGLLSVVDEDANDVFEYSIVGDNTFFEIDGAEIKVKANVNYEFMSEHSLLLQVEDEAGNQLIAAVEIKVNDVNDAPQLIALSADSIPAGLPEYMTVGYFTVVDEDTYDEPILSLVSGEADNDAFMLNPQNQHLVSATTFNTEDGDTRTLKVKADDGNGGVLVADFDIKVLNKGYSYTEKNVNVMFTNSEVFTHYFEMEGEQVIVSITTKDLFGNYDISSTSKVLKYALYSMDGKQLLTQAVDQYDFTLDISAQPLGHYFLNIYTESGVIGEEISVMAK